MTKREWLRKQDALEAVSWRKLHTRVLHASYSLKDIKTFMQKETEEHAIKNPRAEVTQT